MAAKLNVKIIAKAYKEFHDMGVSLSQFMDADYRMGYESSSQSSINERLYRLLSTGMKQAKAALKIAQKFNTMNAKAVSGRKRR